MFQLTRVLQTDRKRGASQLWLDIGKEDKMMVGKLCDYSGGEKGNPR